MAYDNSSYAGIVLPWVLVSAAAAQADQGYSPSSKPDTYTEMTPAARTPAETMPAPMREAREPPAKAAEVREASSDRSSNAAAMARAVEEELRHDPLVSRDAVSVAAENGVITLSGTARSLLAKERATRLAQTVKGVLDVRNEIAVTPRARKSTDDLEASIIHALVMNPATEGFEIQVEGEPNGVVALSGRVDSWAERDLAERVAKGVSGVTAVRNQLELSHEAVRPDDELQAEVERLLRSDVYLDDSRLEIDVRDRVVRLLGYVPSAAEKHRAVSLARVAGTKWVDASAVDVRPDQSSSARTAARQKQDRPSDAYIAQAVRGAIDADPVVEGDRLDLKVVGGVVTLSGEVDSLQAERAAVARASAIDGVLDIRNRLEISDQSTSKDVDIARNVIAALAVNPITEAYKVSVGVERGVVTLTGHVDSWYERGTADDVAANVRGVREVNNRLAVENPTQLLTYDPYVDSWSIHGHSWYTPDSVTARATDSAIVEAVRKELAWSPFVDADDIDVSVRDGVVTLTGQVDSVAERQAAAENAIEGGAVSVNSELVVAAN